MKNLQSAAIVLFAASIAVAGCAARPADTAPSAVAPTQADQKTAAAEVETQPAALPLRFRSVSDPLYDDDVEGITLDEALAKFGREVTLPRSEGAPRKVLFFQDANADPNTSELRILYSTGVELYVRPGGHDLEAVRQFFSSAEFEDSADHGQALQIGSRKVVFNPGGKQTGRAAGNVVLPRILWNEDGLAYDLTASGQGTAAGDHIRAVLKEM